MSFRTRRRRERNLLFACGVVTAGKQQVPLRYAVRNDMK